MNRHKVRRYAIQGGVAVVVFAAGFGTRMYLAKTPTRTAGFTLTSQTITVSEGSAAQTTSASGTIEPKVSDTVNFSTAGTINAVDVTTGQTVNAGQTLATLDSAGLSADVAQAQAQLASAQTRLSDDTSAGASSSTIASDNSAVTQATNALTNAQNSLAGATLTSPIAGTIVSVGLTAGTQAGGGGGSAAASGGVTIIDPASWVVDASVSDASISQIKVGEQVAITPQGVNTQSYGTVASVGLIAQVSGNVATFPFTIDVTGAPAGYYSGLPATLSITTSVTTNAITVPLLAVHGFRTSSPYVMKVTSSGKVKTPVTLGTQSGASVVITKGLQVGDKIVETVPSIAGGGTSRSALRRTFGGGLGGGGLGGGGFGGGGFGGGGG